MSMTDAVTAADEAVDPTEGGAGQSDGLFPAPPPAPPQTGDLVVDRVLADLHASLSQDLDTQIATADEVGAALHRRLQDLDSE